MGDKFVMTDAERREAIRQFIIKWHGRGKEDEDDRSFWLDLFQRVFGVQDATDKIQFQKKVVVKGNTKRIDAYVPETKVLIEQKSLGIALDKPQAGHNGMTPYEQAKEYNDNLPFDEKARWIITSNFDEIWIYDMNTRIPEEEIIVVKLEELRDKGRKLDFIIHKEIIKIVDEETVSKRAGDKVGLLYNAFAEQYGDMEDKENQEALNALCVRLVFCLYAEDAGIFDRPDMFHDYMEQFETKNMRQALIELFKVLDTEEDKRDKFLEQDLAEFKYVNGGLFADADKSLIPPFTDRIRHLLLDEASMGFNWADIDPTIFGAIFESTLNRDTRRKGGMHYTPIENIHKVIDPLFMDSLKDEFDRIIETKQPKARIQKLMEFQNKLSQLKFLDPACGSGNFLTESYLSLRRLENEVLKEMEAARKGAVAGQIAFGDILASGYDPIKVSISQFYGIEINDFAVSVAKAALWIAESQMMKETEDVLHIKLDFLPLKTNAHIIEGNALRMDWKDVIRPMDCSFIMGNPPFLGYSNQSRDQKHDIRELFVDQNGKPYRSAGKIDYVAGWYWKAAEYINNTSISVAFVSTNSITQGEQVAGVWKPLFERFCIHIDFAYRSFEWVTDASEKAQVHCVIIGFSTCDRYREKVIYDKEEVILAHNINPYLVDAANVYVESRKQPLCNISEMITGNRPADGGNLLIKESEYEDFLKAEPKAYPFVKRLIGSEEFINDKKRYCLWLEDADLLEARKMPEVMKRIKACKEMRESSTKKATRESAATPWKFQEIHQPMDKTCMVVPVVSSENRRYVPLGFLPEGTICNDRIKLIPDATLFDFGVLMSNVNMAWLRAVCGRLEMRYNYSKDIVYNNFPWPKPEEEQKANIERTAQGIIDARELYPGWSLADLYAPLTMPSELQKAHIMNDRAVMAAYGFSTKMTEAECVAELMKMYQKLVEEQK